MTHGAGGNSHGDGRKGGDCCNRLQRESNGDDINCCYALCYPVLFLLCLVNMKPKVKIMLTWLYCFTGACVAGGIVALHYSSSSLKVSPTDLRKLEKISGIFCESAQINSTAMITVYNFKTVPKINETSSLRYGLTGSIVFTRNNYVFTGYYVLKNSVIEVSVCPDKGINLYIIIGEKNLITWLRAWERNELCSNSLEHKYVFSNCSGSPDNVTFKATSSDIYYLMLYADDKGPASTNVSLSYTLDRKVYDFNDASIVCFDTFKCDVQLSFRITESIVVFLPRARPYNTIVQFKCHPRYYSYIVLFAVLPFCCGTVVTVIILRKHQQRSRTESQD